VIHTPSGRCASVATVRRPYLYALHFSQVSCVNARFPGIPRSAQSVNLEKPVRLTKSEARNPKSARSVSPEKAIRLTNSEIGSTKTQTGTIGRLKVRDVVASAETSALVSSYCYFGFRICLRPQAALCSSVRSVTEVISSRAASMAADVSSLLRARSGPGL